MDYSEYAALDAVNISTLLELAKSPLHYQARLKEQREGKDSSDTEAKSLGRAIHVAQLEPVRFEREVAVWTGGVRRGLAWDEFCWEHKGRLILREQDYRVCLAIQVAVHEHPVASSYLLADGPVEEAIKWTHAATGLACKSRLDKRVPGARVVVDLKSAASACPFEFARSAARYDYHARAAFYLDAVRHLTGEEYRWVFVAAEKEPPYAVAVYSLPDDAIDAGRRKYEELLGKLKHCRKHDEWPGIEGDKETDLVLPAWCFSPDDGLVLQIGGESVRV